MKKNRLTESYVVNKEEESNTNNVVLDELKKMSELSKNQEMEMNKLNNVISFWKRNQRVVQTTVNDNDDNNNNSNNNNNNDTNTTSNNKFNINIFLNDSCEKAINYEDSIKNILFEHTYSKLMAGSYVEGTFNIMKRNLEDLLIHMINIVARPDLVPTSGATMPVIA